jgi:phosphoserine aminotransferase
MKEGGKAAYLDTGTWSSALLKLNFLEKLLSLSKEDNYNYIPKDYSVP